MGAVDEAFREVDAPAFAQVLSEPTQHALERRVLDPLLKAPMAGRARWVACWHVGPGRTGAHDPQDAVEHISRVAPRPPSSSALDELLRREQLLDEVPLMVGEVHRDRRSEVERDVDRTQLPLKSPWFAPPARL